MSLSVLAHAGVGEPAQCCWGTSVMWPVVSVSLLGLG
jgi:hypothetical protein